MEDKSKVAKLGIGTDKELIEALGLHPSLEGQPGINRAARDAVLQKIYEQERKKHPNLSDDQAMKRAKRIQDRNTR